VLAIDMRSGTVVAVRELDGVPGAIARPPGSWLADGPIYALEAVTRPDGLHDHEPEAQFAEAGEWRLLELNSATLDVDRTHSIRYPLRWPTLAPDGRYLYATTGLGSLVTGSTIVEVDLSTGNLSVLAQVPGWTHSGLAVTQGRLYVPDVEGNRLTVLERRTGRILRSIPTGRHPLGIAVASA
jgi:hypothetical protein